MECELAHWYDMIGDDGKCSGTVIFGRVKRFHIVRHLFTRRTLEELTGLTEGICGGPRGPYEGVDREIAAHVEAGRYQVSDLFSFRSKN